MELEPPLKKMDLIISLCSYKAELLALEAGNAEDGDIDIANMPTILSEMEDLLPDFLENLLALQHTQIELVAKIRKYSQKRLSTPSPPSSPLHETKESPLKKQKTKERSFSYLRQLILNKIN
ncbi:10266_t:CDS:2 [Entrophospora sp. SA101]|nr:14364_t:CDS:2 [Entrophospora sp. SA101]CAJ0909690.1 10266_t:CDS:2 [Entrophospora sp. SA101]